MDSALLNLLSVCYSALLCGNADTANDIALLAILLAILMGVLLAILCLSKVTDNE
jgi:uncharacterized membrane protein YadS